MVIADSDRTRSRAAQMLLLTSRVAMEAGVVAGLCYWGIHIGATTWSKILLGVAAPVVGFGIWGMVDFRSAGRYAEGLRLVEELAISLLAAGALYSTGQHELGWSLAAVSLGYHGLVYACGERLLQETARTKG